MLKAMKEQLVLLSKDDADHFHEILRTKVGKRATEVLEDRLKRIIVLMPDLVARIYYYWNYTKVESKIKSLGGYLLTYLYAPKDLINEEQWGLFGYLDDAYFVAKIYTAVIDEAKNKNINIIQEDQSFYDEAKFLKQHIRGVIPKETEKLDQMIADVVVGNKREFLEVLKQI